MIELFEGLLQSRAGVAMLVALAAAGVYGVASWASAGASAEHLAMGLACLAGAGLGAWERRRR